MAKRSFSLPLTIFACIIALIIGAVAGFLGWTIYKNPHGGDVYVSGDLKIHFLELGNNYTGDSVYIKAGNTDVLIDAGSRKNSAKAITEYVNQFCDDGILEYVIATHAHQDHIAGFVGTKEIPGIFDAYECQTIIDFSKTNVSSDVYSGYLEKRSAEIDDGATHYTALQCWKETDGAKRVYELSNGIELEILYNKFYETETSDENDYSVCVMINQGDKHFLFTGDLEHEGEEELVKNNQLPKVEVFKAGHHGSGTSSSKTLLDVIDPEIICICCCAGSVEYTQDLNNTFPYQAVIDRMAQYTDKVYATTAGQIEYSTEKGKYVDVGFSSLNGNIVVTSNKKGVTVDCSHDDNILKNTTWFKENRTTPTEWLS